MATSSNALSSIFLAVDWSNIIFGIITGIVTGMISSKIVTDWYREKDRCIETSQFIDEVYRYVDRICTVAFFPDGNIPDDYAIRVWEFTKDNPVPLLYAWINLKAEEMEIVSSVLKLCNNISRMSFEVQMKIGWLDRDNYPESGKIDLRKNIENGKMEIFLDVQKLNLLRGSLILERNKYIKTMEEKKLK